MKFQKLVQRALEIDYHPIPDDKKSDWDYIYESLWIGLKNPIQLKALFITVKMFPPLKIIAKLILNSYVCSGN